MVRRPRKGFPPVSPYLSIVVAGRNDNYGGDFLSRVQRFVKVLWGFLKSRPLEVEFILVEWNPPIDREGFSHALHWPPLPGRLIARVIQVPNRIHQQLPNSERILLFEYFAKNVGIRRATGEFILVTNPDVLFTEELMAYLASKELHQSRFYRIDRYDFRGSPPPALDPQGTLSAAKKNIYQVHVRLDKHRKSTIPIRGLRKWFALWSENWPGSYNSNGYGRVPGNLAVPLNDNQEPYGGIHTNASGDFLLASSNNWKKIRGFPEFTDTFTHLDSYACHQLKALGLEQTLLLPPCMLLHEDHPRDEQKTRPMGSPDIWQHDLQAIRDRRMGPAVNSEDWGFAREDLLEVFIENGERV
jgi:hypothetical protein